MANSASTSSSPAGMTDTVPGKMAAYGVAYCVTALFNAALVIVKELAAPVLALMKTLIFHHWITHGVLVLVVFFVTASLVKNSATVQGMTASRLVTWMVASTLVGGGLIFALYAGNVIFGWFD